MIKPLLLLLVYVFALAACDSASFYNPLKKAVREKLKDPDSAKFGDPVVLGNRACISVNAKNSYGGYTGSKYTHLKRISSDNWYVESMEGESECSESVLSQKLSIDKANEDAEIALLKLMKEKKLTEAEVDSVYSIKDKACSDLANGILAKIRRANDSSGEESAGWRARAEQERKLIESGVCKL